MSVALIGANPFVTLMKGQERTGVVSFWEAVWSVHGPGRAVLVWVPPDDAVRLLTPDAQLGEWLADTFSRHFPELDGLPPIASPVDCEFAEWRISQDEVRVEANAVDGSKVVASISHPVHVRPGYAAEMRLGDVPWTLTNLLTFCRDATLRVDGTQAEGQPRLTTEGGRTLSTAFVATYETWTRQSMS